MANILIKDLNESREMDREAMRAVAGGCGNSYFSQTISPYRTGLLQPDLMSGMFNWATSNSGNQSS